MPLADVRRFVRVQKALITLQPIADKYLVRKLRDKMEQVPAFEEFQLFFIYAWRG
jgi:hypothetical protein